MGYGKPKLATDRELEYHQRKVEKTARRGTRIGMKLEIESLSLDSPGGGGKIVPMNDKDKNMSYKNDERQVACEIGSLAPPMIGSCQGEINFILTPKPYPNPNPNPLFNPT